MDGWTQGRKDGWMHQLADCLITLSYYINSNSHCSGDLMQ